MAAFGGVLPIVEANRENVGRRNGREKFAGNDDAIGQAEVAEKVAGNFARGAVGLERSVGRAGRGEVADEFHDPKKGGRQTPGNSGFAHSGVKIGIGAEKWR